MREGLPRGVREGVPYDEPRMQCKDEVLFGWAPGITSWSSVVFRKARLCGHGRLCTAVQATRSPSADGHDVCGLRCTPPLAASGSRQPTVRDFGLDGASERSAECALPDHCSTVPCAHRTFPARATLLGFTK